MKQPSERVLRSLVGFPAMANVGNVDESFAVRHSKDHAIVTHTNPEEVRSPSEFHRPLRTRINRQRVDGGSHPALNRLWQVLVLAGGRGSDDNPVVRHAFAPSCRPGLAPYPTIGVARLAEIV